MTDTPPAYGVNVLDHDVAGDGLTDDAPAIQKLLDGDTQFLYFPAGLYLIGQTLRLPSNTRIKAHRFAHFYFADGAGRDIDSFLLCNADPESGNEHISIQGGIWDGNNINNPRGEEEDRQGYTGTLANFRHVHGLSLLDMTLRNSTAYHIRLSGVQDFRVERLRFEDSHHTPNQDGVHVAGCCEDGLIRDIKAVGPACTGDDLIALNADDALDRCETRGKLGGPIRRVRVHGLRADDCHSFVRMASVWSEIEDIEVNDVRGGCRVCLLNADALRFCAGPLFRRDDERYAQGAGLLRNIRLRNIAVYKSGTSDMPLLRLDTRMDSLEVENFERLFMEDSTPQTPTIQVAYQNTDNIVLEGIGQDESQQTEETSDCTYLRASRLPRAIPEAAAFRLEAGIEATGHFLCLCSRFDRFRAEHARVDPLPEPDWMVAKGQYL